MIRVGVLLASTAFFLGVILLVNWWVDPFGDRYRGDVVARALRQVPRCDVSTGVLGETTWPEYKVDLFRRRSGRTIVVGTSRVWQMGARPGERDFVNESLPGMVADSVPILFRRLASIAEDRRITVYLNVDPFWFTTLARSSSFAPVTLTERIRRLGSAETLRGTLTRLGEHPGDLIHPPSRQAAVTATTLRGCLLMDKGDLTRRENAWAPDGTFVYNYELAGGAQGQNDFLRGEGAGMRGSSLASEPLQRIRDAIAIARAHNWNLIGFSAPFSPGTVARLRRVPQSVSLLRVFRTEMPPLFAAAGYRFVNLLESGEQVSCTDADFTRHDGAHMTPACADRVRRVLDATTR